MEYCIFPEDPEFQSSGTQDPYCAWDTREEVCRGSQTWSPDTQTTFLQVPISSQLAILTRTKEFQTWFLVLLQNLF